MENLAIDENTRNVLGAITNDASELIKNLRVNPVTGRLIVDAHLTSTNTEMGDTIPGGTAGSVLFLGLGSTLAQDNANFFYDDTQNFLGLGNNTPSATLDITGTLKYVDGNEAVGYVLISDASGNAAWGDLSADTTFVTNLANDTTFTNALVANNTFTTALANDTNFYTTLAGNTSFTTLLNGKVAVAVDGTTITGDGTTGNPLVATGGGGGTGTVTSVSVVSANGFAGSVANPTTTPALTLSTTITGILQGNGTAISAATTTGSGAVVLATSPTLVTPALGTPTSVTLTNATGLPLTSGVTGILPVANGGTGVASLTAYAPLFGGTTSTNPIQSGTVGTAGQVLTSNGAGALPTFQNPSSGLALTSIPQPNFQTAGTITGKVNNSNTLGHVAQMVIPFSITVNKISFNVSAVGTSGTLKIALYTEDGQTKVFEVTTANIAGTGIVTTSLGAPTALTPGMYYIAVLAQSTAAITTSSWTTVTTTNLIDGITAEPRLEGSLIVSADTLPTTFDPTNDPSGSPNCALYFRLDN